MTPGSPPQKSTPRSLKRSYPYDPCTPVSGTALSEFLEVKTSAGRLLGAYGFIDASASTDVYYVQFFDAGAEPADTTAVSAAMPTAIVVNHTNGTPSPWQLDLKGKSVNFSSGLYIVISTTQFTKTETGDIGAFTAFIES